MTKKNIDNKALVSPPVAKAPTLRGASALIFDENDVIVITEQTIRENPDDNVAKYINDGKAWLRRPEKHLRKNLTRERRMALARRGIKLDE